MGSLFGFDWRNSAGIKLNSNKGKHIAQTKAMQNRYITSRKQATKPRWRDILEVIRHLFANYFG